MRRYEPAYFVENDLLVPVNTLFSANTSLWIRARSSDSGFRPGKFVMELETTDTNQHSLRSPMIRDTQIIRQI